MGTFYVGAQEEIANYLKKIPKETREGEYLSFPCNLYGVQNYKSNSDVRWEHTNIWGYPYFMYACGYNNEHIWIETTGNFYRCIKPKFNDLKYTIEDNYTNLHTLNSFWGQPCMIYKTDNIVKSSLFIIEKKFKDYAEMAKDYFTFSENKSNYTNFCNDIFADG